MKLIFIYGAPAVGKLTVATALSQLIGYKIFHSHLSADFVMSLFSWDHPQRRRLTEKFRIEMIGAGAKEGVNIIFTYGAVGEKFNAFVSKIITVVEQNGGEVCFVKLICDREILMKRVLHPSRMNHNKITTREELEEKLKEVDYSQDFPHKPSFSINTTSFSPQKTAQSIIEYFKLEK